MSDYQDLSYRIDCPKADEYQMYRDYVSSKEYRKIFSSTESDDQENNVLNNDSAAGPSCTYNQQNAIVYQQPRIIVHQNLVIQPPQERLVTVVPQQQGNQKVKRTRTFYTPTQLHVLEMEFSRDQHTGPERRTEIAKLLNLCEDRIRVWFQNRRMKWKKAQAARPSPY